jgi:hypothetical protein
MAGPLEPLKTNMELQNPQDIEKAMSLARAYKQRNSIVIDLTKTATTLTRTAAHPPLPPKMASSASTASRAPASTTATLSTTLTHASKFLITEEMAKCHHMGLCFNCDN